MARLWMPAAILVGLGVLIGGCLQNAEIFTCPNNGRIYVDPQGEPDACREGPSCAGECVPIVPIGWFGPVLLWTGPEGKPPPSCPESASKLDYRVWHADLVVPNECGACSCTPSTGACELPTSIAARAASCPGTGAWVTPFDGPAGWDGACTDVNAIPQGKDCGGVPCVQSLVNGSMKMIENGCTPIQGPPPTPLGGPSWQTQARVCQVTTQSSGDCEDGLLCVPKADPPPEFKQCIWKENDELCPPDYPAKSVFYDNFVNGLTCTPCACGPTMGSMCTALLRGYTDNTCGNEYIKLSIGSVSPACVDIVPPGLPLGSKRVTDIVYHPGTCQVSGGEPVGAVEPSEPSTFCCRADP